jgi:hypothetical protein
MAALREYKSSVTRTRRLCGRPGPISTGREIMALHLLSELLLKEAVDMIIPRICHPAELNRKALAK